MPPFYFGNELRLVAQQAGGQCVGRDRGEHPEQISRIGNNQKKRNANKVGSRTEERITFFYTFLTGILILYILTDSLLLYFFNRLCTDEQAWAHITKTYIRD